MKLYKVTFHIEAESEVQVPDEIIEKDRNRENNYGYHVDDYISKYLFDKYIDAEKSELKETDGLSADRICEVDYEQYD